MFVYYLKKRVTLVAHRSRLVVHKKDINRLFIKTDQDGLLIKTDQGWLFIKTDHDWLFIKEQTKTGCLYIYKNRVRLVVYKKTE